MNTAILHRKPLSTLNKKLSKVLRKISKVEELHGQAILELHSMEVNNAIDSDIKEGQYFVEIYSSKLLHLFSVKVELLEAIGQNAQNQLFHMAQFPYNPATI